MQKDKFMGNLKLIKDLNPFYLLLEPKEAGIKTLYYMCIF